MESKFVLQPCHVREDRFVDTDVAALVFTAEELVRCFAPKREYVELMKLRAMRPGSFFGRIKGGRTGRPTNFYFFRDDRRNSMRAFLKKDPTLAERVLEVYRVERADWGSKVEESESGSKDTPKWERAKPTSHVQETRR
jgi:hypothetical protein